MHRIITVKPLISTLTLFIMLVSILLPVYTVQARPLAASITETFEDESHTATTFSQSSISFNVTGDLMVEYSLGLGCCPSNYWLGTGYGNGGTSGSAGKIQITTSGMGFLVEEMDAWTSENDGTSYLVGNVTFIGTKATGGTVSEMIYVEPTGNEGSDFDHISFAGTNLNGVLLTELEIVPATPLDYISIDNFKFDTASTLPEIDVQGNGNSIADGDTTPDTTDDTDFGSTGVGTAIAHTFTISNSGITDLTLSNAPNYVALSTGTHFGVSQQPSSGTVSGNSTVDFALTFIPQSTGSFTDTVTIDSNDSNETPYNFVISGTGVVPPVMQSIYPISNTLNVTTTTTISATFDQNINATTVTSHTFKVYGEQSGLVTATHDVIHNNTIIVTPTNAFHAGEVGRVNASSQIESSVGVTLATPYAWQFTVDAQNGDGDGMNWVTQMVDTAFGGASSVYAADIDGDGDLDVLGAATSGNEIAWWENTSGDGTAWSKHSVDASFNDAYSVYAADVDGDGDLDVLGAAYFANEIAWWENTSGDGTAWSKHSVDASFNDAWSV
ncbi:MAG: choice-of-anchor D domain-containing protein, partial [Chloroflexi bacterium]|nr:choice-of-anchor D domain-containing protein [Chloroflexota bacterium]